MMGTPRFSVLVLAAVAETAAGPWRRFCDALRARLGPPLKSLHAPLDAWLDGLPMSVALGCVLTLFALTALWVWTLKRDYVYLGAPDQSRWRDLRLWATLLLVPYVVVYVALGR